MNSWIAITGVGSAASMVPAAAAIALILGFGRAWKSAAIWLSVFGLGVAFTAASKIAFLGWGIGIRALNFTGISGHTLLAASVCLTVMYLVSRETSAKARTGWLAVGVACAIAVGLSRLALRMHSPAEVVAGWCLGALVALGFAFLSSRYETRRGIPRLALLGSFVAIVAATHGARAPTQDWLTRVALQLSGHAKPFERGTWLRSGDLADWM